MSEDTTVHQTIDVTDRACPMSFVKAKLALEEIAVGHRIEILVRGGEACHNVPRSFESEGQRVVSLEPVDEGEQVWRLVIERCV